MDIKASAGRNPRLNFFEHCESLTLKARSPHEARWMGALARVITSGGELDIRPRGKDPVVVEFADSFAPRPTAVAVTEDDGEAD